MGVRHLLYGQSTAVQGIKDLGDHIGKFGTPGQHVFEGRDILFRLEHPSERFAFLEDSRFSQCYIPLVKLYDFFPLRAENEKSGPQIECGKPSLWNFRS